MRSGKTDDVIIVGGGIVGMAVARNAAHRGLRVRVLDRDRPGAGATGAAAGLLSPLSETSEAGPFLDAGLASLRLYPAWVEHLRGETDVDPWFRPDGKVRVARHPAARAGLAALEARAAAFGLGVHRLAHADLAERLGVEPGTEPASFEGALFLEEDHQVDSRRLHRALTEAARRAGVEIVSDTPVRGLEFEGDRTVGVRVDGGQLAAGAVVLAAGARSGQMEGLPFPLPVRPVRGQMLALEAGSALPDRVLESEDVYLVPRGDGRLLVGATVEEAGFQEVCTPEARAWLLEAAGALLPRLRSAPVLDQWCGLRPGTPDLHPILGAAPGVRDLYLGTGHYRNGVLLAPWTAEALGCLLAGEAGPEIPDAFLPHRFHPVA